MKINLKKSTNKNHSVFNPTVQNGLGGRNGATSPFFVRKSNNSNNVHSSSNSSHDGKSSHSSGSAGGSPPLQKRNIGGGNANFGLGLPTSRFSQMSINDLKSEKFSTPNSIIKERFFGSQNPHYNNNNNNNNNNNRFGQPSVVKPNANNRLAQADFQDAQNQMKIQQQKIREAESNNATAESKAMQTLQQIQEAKPGNKRAILTDLPEYLYSIPALASFFEPYGEVAMLQILPLQRMWDGDLIDLLGASMCTRLAQGTYCAIVEFYSARMAKFIIGILRKRLPVLKFRCALLKPSAAIELTNQADNLGLTKAVKLRHIPAQNKGDTDKKLSDSENGSSGCAASHIVDSESENNSNIGKGMIVDVGPVETPVVSSEESGMDELSSSNNQTESNVSSSSSCNESEPEVNSQNSSNENQESTSSSSTSNENNNQRFVTSFRIQLNR
jgi:hypothetical protein